MMHDLSQSILNHIVDYLYIGFAYPILWISQLYITTATFIFLKLPLILLGIFLTIVLTQSKNPFYWKKIKKNPFKVIETASEHPVFKFFGKLYTNSIALLFLLLALLKGMSLLNPGQYEHIRTAILEQPDLVFKAFSTFLILSLIAVSLKIYFYVILGFCKSAGDFKLKMIFQ